jgi:acyl-homoserine-lactone acylase
MRGSIYSLMLGKDLRRVVVYLACCVLVACLMAGGCSKLARPYFRDTVEELHGTLKLPGLTEPVMVRRDAFAIPFIDARNMNDLVMAIGYINASDRLTQMVALKLVSQGRIAELAGPLALDLDIYIRTIGLPQRADKLLKNMNLENRALLERYCEGVNIYMEQHRDKLPPGLALTGYKPDKWTPIDSISIFELVNLGLSFNLHEEIGSLSVAQAVGAEKAAWLLPIYPDEPIQLDEAQKLKDVDFKKAIEASSRVARAEHLLNMLGLDGIAASNNWAISKDRTARGSSILANDTHLILSMPSLWNMMHVKCGKYEAAGVGIAGIPLICAGYNGHIAWGMTMVMADNQDIFLEQLKNVDGTILYLYKGQWLPVSQRVETFAIKGRDPVHITISETRHGPLLGDILKKDSTNMLQPQPVDLPYGIALSWAATSEDDESVDAFFNLSFASTVDEAISHMKQFRAMALNMVIADKDNIAWQVTGNYPVRAKGRGLMPSPGWTGEYDWTGYLDAAALPWVKNPAQGFIGTANNRTIPKDYPHIISSSWYWPERAARIEQMATSTNRHTLQSCMEMQLDTHSLLVPKLKEALLAGKLFGEISQEIASWKDEDKRKKAQLAIEMLSRFDGNLNVDSSDAAIVGALIHCATRNIFLDELGPERSNAWRGFLVINNASYNATCDHLLVRGDGSPFWDDIRTTAKETKAQIIARSLHDAYELLESRLGSDRARWRWGDLHTYVWETESSKMASHTGIMERIALWSLWSYFNRGPYPAPGDHTTLNVSAYYIGQDFDTWLIPAMRIIVDFSLDEPMYAMNSSGQSDNPSSPYYDDAIPAWLKGSYTPMPFGEEAVKQLYREVLVLEP